MTLNLSNPMPNTPPNQEQRLFELIPATPEMPTKGTYILLRPITGSQCFGIGIQDGKHFEWGDEPLLLRELPQGYQAGAGAEVERLREALEGCVEWLPELINEWRWKAGNIAKNQRDYDNVTAALEKAKQALQLLTPKNTTNENH